MKFDSTRVLGKRIIAIRRVLKAEASQFGWDEAPQLPIVIVLDDGTQIVVARDPELNDGGALFVFDDAGDDLVESEFGNWSLRAK